MKISVKEEKRVRLKIENKFTMNKKRKKGNGVKKEKRKKKVKELNKKAFNFPLYFIQSRFLSKQ